MSLSHNAPQQSHNAPRQAHKGLESQRTQQPSSEPQLHSLVTEDCVIHPNQSSWILQDLIKRTSYEILKYVTRDQKSQEMRGHGKRRLEVASMGPFRTSSAKRLREPDIYLNTMNITWTWQHPKQSVLLGLAAIALGREGHIFMKHKTLEYVHHIICQRWESGETKWESSCGETVQISSFEFYYRLLSHSLFMNTLTFCAIELDSVAQAKPSGSGDYHSPTKMVTQRNQKRLTDPRTLDAIWGIWQPQSGSCNSINTKKTTWVEPTKIYLHPNDKL